MKPSEVKKGDRVWLHTGKSTRSPKDENTIYVVVSPPDRLFPDGAGIRDAYRGGNVYNVATKRLSLYRA